MLSDLLYIGLKPESQTAKIPEQREYLMKFKNLNICLIVLFASTNVFASFSSTKINPGSIKGTVRAATGGTDKQSTLVSKARLKLTNPSLPKFILSVVSDDSGAFIFESVPAGKYVLTVEADSLPTITREITLASGEQLVLDIDLNVSLNESVTIRYEEGLLSTSDTTTSNVVLAQTLATQPFKDDNYQSALPLTPGIVQDASGNTFVKGSRASQSNSTVNGADVTDPITGEPVFELPLESVSSIQVEENPYSAEYGNFTGGVTKIESKSGGDDFKVNFARFFPTFNNVISSTVDSFRPRLTLSGPIIKNRLSFLQSFEYRFRRINVPNLENPFNDTIIERFNSFSQLDLTINKSNALKVNFAIFPQKTRYYGLNTFNPAQVTPNVKQRGYLLSLSEQKVFKNTSFLVSAVNYKTAEFDVFGQNTQPLTIVSDINRGNYFADTRRESSNLQWQETYFFRTYDFHGKHTPKTGLEFNHINVAARLNYNSIFLRRLDNTLAQRVDFVNHDRFDYGYNDFGAFFQNRWVLNPKLTLDGGIRFDYDGVSEKLNPAPRFSLLYSPFANNRTIFRAGVGLFYDRTLPVAGYFGDGTLESSTVNQIPNRVVTNYAANGTTIIGAARVFSNQVSDNITSPRSFRYSFNLDQGITKNIIIRLGYLQREGTNELIVQPFEQSANSGSLVLSSDGESSYREFQVLASYNNARYGTWNASYVWSQSRGDLNTADALVGNFPSFVVRPNDYGPQPFDVPHRLLVYGQIDLPYGIRIAPLIEFRSGFPFSAINDRLDFIGERNEAGRFPKYLSVDTQISKSFPIPYFKRFDKYKLRAGLMFFNMTNNFNPRDVQNNISNPNYGNFYNSLGFQVKGLLNIELK